MKSIIELQRELRECIAEHENLIHGIKELMTLGAPVMDFEELRVGLFELRKWESRLQELKETDQQIFNLRD